MSERTYVYKASWTANYAVSHQTCVVRRHPLYWLLAFALLLSFELSAASTLADNDVTLGHDFPGVGKINVWLQANFAFDRGNNLFKSGDYTGAIISYKLAISTYPHDRLYYYNLALAFKRTGELESAEQAFKKSLSLKEAWDAWVSLGQLFQAEGRYEEAKVAFLKAIKNQPPPIVRVRIEKELAELGKNPGAGK